jgi:hypothetical protein
MVFKFFMLFKVRKIQMPVLKGPSSQGTDHLFNDLTKEIVGHLCAEESKGQYSELSHWDITPLHFVPKYINVPKTNVGLETPSIATGV